MSPVGPARRLVLSALAAVGGLVLAVVAAGGRVAAAEDWRAAATLARMGPGINILGYDGLWDGGTDAPFKRSHFRRIREAGFRHVRINVHAFRHMDAADRLPSSFLAHLDWAVSGAIEAGLVPVVDEHDFDACQRDPARCARRLAAFWGQVAPHYAGRHPSLVFELLNEPGGAITAAWWNARIPELLAIVRASNPARTVIVPAVNADGPETIRDLALPADDRNLIVTFHYYRPMRFTHQGAPWAGEAGKRSGIDWGTAAERARVRADFAIVADWARREKRPIYLGEFGVYDRAPVAARARYAAFVARSAEVHGWAWAWWQFDHDFAAFDSDRDGWVANVRDALLPRR